MASYETFGEIYRAVCYDLGYVTPGDASEDFVAAVKRTVNDVHRDIHNKTGGRYLHRHRNYRPFAQVDEDAGATVVVGGTTVELPGAVITPDDTFIGRDILFGTSLLPYTIVGYDTGPDPDELTISPAYVADANLTDGAFKIYNAHLTLPDDFDRELSLVHMEDHRPIHFLPFQEARRRFPNPWQQTTTGSPTRWTLDGVLELESPGAGAHEKPWRALLFPIITAAMDLELVYYKIVTQLVDDADTPDMPPEFRQYLKHGAFVQAGQTFGNKSPQALSMSVIAFREGLETMKMKPKQEARPLQLGSVYDNAKKGLAGNLPEDDVYSYQHDGIFWP